MMKVGKEELVGFIVALQRYVERDEAAELAGWRAKLDHVAAAISELPGVQVCRIDPATHRVAVPTIQLDLDQDALQMTAYEVLNRLQDGDPAVFLNEEHAWRGTLTVNPMALRDGDERVLAERLKAVLCETIAGPERR